MSAMGGNPLTRGQPFPWHTANQPPCPDWGKSPADWPRPTFRDDLSHVASHGQVPVCITTGVNLLTGFGQRSDHYICVKKGGTCNFSSCPLFQRIEGTCYGRKAKCCIR
ncbi:beta-defensin 1 isoform X1 [Phocoena sinus]|uniref:beta-defensin 1 isoform X1 n=1 Tax=Phocoena sinus TaxID=42100 RepID=UPI0013C505C8|nr:beta-defensin 1 isoform X1 [Phocoena sinus]